MIPKKSFGPGRNPIRSSSRAGPGNYGIVPSHVSKERDVGHPPPTCYSAQKNKSETWTTRPPSGELVRLEFPDGAAVALRTSERRCAVEVAISVDGEGAVWISAVRAAEVVQVPVCPTGGGRA